MHHGASNEIFERARILRENPTRAESKLWNHLRNRRFNGLKFRRQHPIMKYVLDFYCHYIKLCIELDGRGHQQPSQEFYDEDRTRNLEEIGIKVIRFSNDEIFENIEHVLKRLQEEIQLLLSKRDL